MIAAAEDGASRGIMALALAAVVSSREGTKMFRTAAAMTQKSTTGIASTRSQRAAAGCLCVSFLIARWVGTGTGPVSASSPGSGGCWPEVMLPSPCMRLRRRCG
ncbi:Uncharacterised protein [Mycobacteroides abscessus subsp. abscessus]|nr:Uncharacterised protein [Mycobacteroides abscessus subsp. abscessus]